MFQRAINITETKILLALSRIDTVKSNMILIQLIQIIIWHTRYTNTTPFNNGITFQLVLPCISDIIQNPNMKLSITKTRTTTKLKIE